VVICKGLRNNVVRDFNSCRSIKNILGSKAK